MEWDQLTFQGLYIFKRTSFTIVWSLGEGKNEEMTWRENNDQWERI